MSDQDDERQAASEGDRVPHFVPNRYVDVGKLSEALTDVFGEHGIRGTSVRYEIDEEYWRKFRDDAWSGNVYTYRFTPGLTDFDAPGPIEERGLGDADA